jgi:sigma-B regulation protein RsbU (phosphoserine phosphatase)
MRLLIAEDNSFFVNMLRRFLSPEYEIITANDGAEAWNLLQGSDAPRLALVDWVMPGFSGPELCRKVRACPRLSSMYLILFTARNSVADVVSGFRAGADDYITKPFQPEELLVRVKLGKFVLDLQAASGKEQARRQQSLLSQSGPCHLIESDLRLRSHADHVQSIHDCLIGPLQDQSKGSNLLEFKKPFEPEFGLENVHA